VAATDFPEESGKIQGDVWELTASSKRKGPGPFGTFSAILPLLKGPTSMWTWVTQNILSLINLAAFVISVLVLWRTMKAIERQTERTSKPVIVLRRTDWSLPGNELLEPQLNVEALIPFQIKNVGNGTALVVHWRFRKDSGEELIHGMLPQLQVDSLLKTGLSAEQLGLKQGVSRIFECDYQSVSGETYRSVIAIENLKLVKFEVKKI
jgi:hypothetical protein